MNIRLPVAVALSALLLAACGNKDDLLRPSEVPPEDAGRFLIKSSVPTQAQRDAAETWDDEDESEDTGVDADEGETTPPAVPVPVIEDVPATGTP